MARAPVSAESTASADSASQLRVIGKCDCGCDTVEFASHESQSPSQPMADGVGQTAKGGSVGVDSVGSG